jgi:hypothetical protein
MCRKRTHSRVRARYLPTTEQLGVSYLYIERRNGSRRKKEWKFARATTYCVIKLSLGSIGLPKFDSVPDPEPFMSRSNFSLSSFPQNCPALHAPGRIFSVSIACAVAALYSHTHTHAPWRCWAQPSQPISALHFDTSDISLHLSPRLHLPGAPCTRARGRWQLTV